MKESKIINNSLTLPESEVMATTPSLSNTQATWSGWAMSAVTSKFYNKNQKTNKPAGDSSSAQTETGSIASGNTHASYSTTSSNVSQHSEDQDQEEDEEEIDEGEWGEMEVSLFLKSIQCQDHN